MVTVSNKRVTMKKRDNGQEILEGIDSIRRGEGKKYLMYTKTTHHICVTVDPAFLEDQSFPLDKLYVWAYRIWIENQGPDTIQLVKRTWRITDADGIIQEVKGDGVVGEKPWITPGETYQYTSGTPLSTPSGMMEGIYHMHTKEGKTFDVVIPAFSLDSPYETASVH